MQYRKVIELFADYAYLRQVVDEMRHQTYVLPAGYTDYLSNSKQFREIFEKNALLQGKKTLLVAGCGAGKTKYALSDLAKALLGRRQVVLAVPTSLQATQNGNTYNFVDASGNVYQTEGITGREGNITVNPKRPISFVYDCAHRFFTLSQERLSKMVLIIDEAHQMYSAKQYRDHAINELLVLADLVLQAGGSVIYMTGTPNKILGLGFDLIIKAEKQDEYRLGQTAKKYNFDEIEVLRKKSHHYSLIDVVVETAKKYKEEGRKPIFRINSKRKINKIRLRLEMEGLRVVSITSNNKGVTITKDSKGNKIKKYDSKAYESVSEWSVLPDADCYLVTSILEVGTSIKGIQLDDDKKTIIQPENFTPVFVCMRAEDCDMDDMEQFFARPRFHIEKAAVVMSISQERQKKERVFCGYERILRCLWYNSADNAEIANNPDPMRTLLPTFDGKYEYRFIKSIGNGHYDIDFLTLIGRAQELYERQAYQCPEHTMDLFKEHFQDTKIVISEANGKAQKDKAPECVVPVELVDEWKRILSISNMKAFANKLDPELTSEKLIEAVLDPNGVNFNAQVVEHLRTFKIKEIDNEDTGIGLSMINTVRKVASCATLSLSEIVDVAAGMLSDTKKKKKAEENAAPKVNLQDMQRQSMLTFMASWNEVQVDAFIAYYRKYSDNPAIQLDMKEDIDLSNCFTKRQIFMIDSARKTKVVDQLVSLRIVGKSLMDWKKTCLGTSKMSEEEFLSYVRMVFYVYVNKMNDESARTFATAKHSLAGALYSVLRFGGYDFPIMYPKKDSEEREEHFSGGFAGWRVTEYDLEQLSKNMPELIKAAGCYRHSSCKYTPDDIWLLLHEVYSCSNECTEPGKRACVVRSLKKNVCRLGTDNSRISNREYLINQIDEVFADRRFTAEEKHSKMTEMVTELLREGHCDHVVANRLVNEMNNMLMGGVYKFGFRYGMFRTMFEFYKQYPDQSCTLMDIYSTSFGSNAQPLFEAELNEIDEAIAEYKEQIENEADQDTSMIQHDLEWLEARKTELYKQKNQMVKSFKQSYKKIQKLMDETGIAHNQSPEDEEFWLGEDGMVDGLYAHLIERDANEQEPEEIDPGDMPATFEDDDIPAFMEPESWKEEINQATDGPVIKDEITKTSAEILPIKEAAPQMEVTKVNDPAVATENCYDEEKDQLNDSLPPVPDDGHPDFDPMAAEYPDIPDDEYSEDDMVNMNLYWDNDCADVPNFDEYADILDEMYNESLALDLAV